MRAVNLYRDRYPENTPLNEPSYAIVRTCEGLLR